MKRVKVCPHCHQAKGWIFVRERVLACLNCNAEIGFEVWKNLELKEVN